METLVIVNTLIHSSVGSFLQVAPDIHHKVAACCNKRRNAQLVCGSTNKESIEPSKDGDEQRQELLARMAQLQAQKVRFTNFLDERSEYLRKFAEEADVEFDAIAEETSKGAEEASERIMENLESQMKVIEDDADLNREEIERNERVLQEFEELMDKEKNEGMFFKSLKTAPNKETTKSNVDVEEETGKLREGTKERIRSGIRQNIYLALGSLMILTIAYSTMPSPMVLDLEKIALLAAILFPLIALFLYEQSMSSETTKEEEK